jgi:hypothetical protein
MAQIVFHHLVVSSLISSTPSLCSHYWRPTQRMTWQSNLHSCYMFDSYRVNFSASSGFAHSIQRSSRIVSQNGRQPPSFEYFPVNIDYYPVSGHTQFDIWKLSLYKPQINFCSLIPFFDFRLFRLQKTHFSHFNASVMVHCRINLWFYGFFMLFSFSL